MRSRVALMLVVGLIACAVAQAFVWPGLFLSWPIQDVERRQAMVQAGYPAVVFTTRPDTESDESPEKDSPREVVGVATDPTGLIRAPWDTEVEIHLNYALSGGGVDDCYATIGGERVEAKRAKPDSDKDNRFGTFDKRSQILRLRYRDKVDMQQRYNSVNPGMFREDLPLQIVSIDPTGERKEKTWLFGLWKTVSKRSVAMSQTLVFHWENKRGWSLGQREEKPTTARMLREQIAGLRMLQRTSVEVSGDALMSDLYAMTEPEMQLWVSSPKVVIEYLDQEGQPTPGPRYTGLVMFFAEGQDVHKPWLPGDSVVWCRLGGNIRYPDYLMQRIQRHQGKLVPYVLRWEIERSSRARFVIHQQTFNDLPDDMKAAYLVTSQPIGDGDVRWWDWAEGAVDGAELLLANGTTVHRVIQETDREAPRFSGEVDFKDLLIGIR
ncbi:MAG: hypothetical protein Q7S64_03500 [bacterium]|nr:hypothetical protein [bacterium]